LFIIKWNNVLFKRLFFRYTFLILSPILCFLSNNWLVVWVCLELRTLTFTFNVIINRTTKTEPEAAIKYFIIQSSASGLLLALFLLKFFMLMSRKEKVLLRLVLILKIGVIPFHLWFLRVTKTLTWNFLTVLITWQKLAPIYLIIFRNKLLLMVRAMSSMLIGTLLQYKNNRLRILIAYSSISNSCWIMIGLLINTLIITIFVTIYFLSVILINIILKRKTLIKRSVSKKTVGMYTIFFFHLTTERNATNNVIHTKMINN